MWTRVPTNELPELACRSNVGACLETPPKVALGRPKGGPCQRPFLWPSNEARQSTFTVEESERLWIVLVVH